MDVKRFGANLDAERTRKRMTQDDLADETGFCRGTISSWERGTREPTLRAAVIVAEALGVGIEDLLK